jgi:hypothetical protein
LTLTFATWGAEPEPATPAGTVPVTSVLVSDALLLFEWPRKNARANAAAPTPRAIKTMRALLLIREARL